MVVGGGVIGSPGLALAGGVVGFGVLICWLVVCVAGELMDLCADVNCTVVGRFWMWLTGWEKGSCQHLTPAFSQGYAEGYVECGEEVFEWFPSSHGSGACQPPKEFGCLWSQGSSGIHAKWDKVPSCL